MVRVVNALDIIMNIFNTIAYSSVQNITGRHFLAYKQQQVDQSRSDDSMQTIKPANQQIATSRHHDDLYKNYRNYNNIAS